MNTTQIAFKSLLKGIVHRRKRIVVVIVAFALLGGFGTFLLPGGSAPESDGYAEPLPAIDVKTIADDENHLHDMATTIEDACSNAGSYLVELEKSGELSSEQRLQSVQLRGRIRKVQSQNISALYELMLDEFIWVKPGHAEDAMSEYRSRLESIKRSLYSSQEASELVKTMQIPDPSDETSYSYYKVLLERAVQYGPLLEKQARIETILSQYENEPKQYEAQIVSFENSLVGCAETVNALSEEISRFADEVCGEKLLILKVNPQGDGTAAPTLQHGHRSTSAGESALAIISFASFVGLCVGVFWSACLEAGKAVTIKKSPAPETDNHA